MSSRSSSAAGDRKRVCAAASSSASGSPSSRRQISATSRAVLSVSVTARPVASARSRKTCPAGDAVTAAASERAGRGSGSSGRSRSARMRSAARLVASTTRPGQRASSSATSGAASSTCSRLSRTTQDAPPREVRGQVARRARSEWTPSTTPSAVATRGRTTAGSRTADRSTNVVPSGKELRGPRQHLGRQPGLAHPARPGQRDEPSGGLGDSGVAATRSRSRRSSSPRPIVRAGR